MEGIELRFQLPFLSPRKHLPKLRRHNAVIKTTRRTANHTPLPPFPLLSPPTSSSRATNADGVFRRADRKGNVLDARGAFAAFLLHSLFS